MSLFPSMASRMFTPVKVLTCETVNNKGQVKKSYKESEETFFIAFSNFQGTEVQKDGVLTILETAVVCSPYDSKLKATDAIKLVDTGAIYEIISPPENWNMQNLFSIYKVQRLKGGV